MKLETTEFGRTRIQVTRLGYGAMELRKIPENEADNILNLVLDSDNCLNDLKLYS